MSFMFSRKSQRTNSQNNDKMVMSLNHYKSNKINTNVNNLPNTNVVTKKILPKMLWGKPTWTLLHCLVEKTKQEYFTQIKEQLIQQIYIICTNLPCPYCSSHAKTYLSKINFKAITTKEELKYMLYLFHNTVNKDKNYVIVNESILDTYKQYSIVSVFNEFIRHFSDKNKGSKLIAGSLFRHGITINLKKWFQENINKFEL